MAISAYQRGQIKSILRAAQVFAIPENTLRDRLHGSKSRAERRANGHWLTESEEELLLKRLLDADKRGFPFGPNSYVEWIEYCFAIVYKTLPVIVSTCRVGGLSIR